MRGRTGEVLWESEERLGRKNTKVAAGDDVARWD